jgi:hypothetical protein
MLYVLGGSAPAAAAVPCATCRPLCGTPTAVGGASTAASSSLLSDTGLSLASSSLKFGAPGMPSRGSTDGRSTPSAASSSSPSSIAGGSPPPCVPGGGLRRGLGAPPSPDCQRLIELQATAASATELVLGGGLTALGRAVGGLTAPPAGQLAAGAAANGALPPGALSSGGSASSSGGQLAPVCSPAPQQPAAGEPEPATPSAATAVAAAPTGAAGGGGGEPPLARSLGVSVASLERLFRADGAQDWEQPVWMVVNLQVGWAAGGLVAALHGGSGRGPPPPPGGGCHGCFAWRQRCAAAARGSQRSAARRARGRRPAAC